MEAIFRLALLLLHVGLATAAAVHDGGGGAQLRGRRLAHLRGDNEERQRLPAAVADFLHTGDSSALERANCSRRFELPRGGGRSPESPHRSALDAVLHAANFLSLVLQANRSREQSVRRDVEWYHALVRSLLLGEQKIHRAVVAFSSDGPGVHLQATRAGGEIVLQDLSGLHNRSRDGEWYHGVKHRRKTTFQKKMLSQDSFAAVHDSLRRGESLIPDKTHVKWSAPYLECDNGNFVPRWLLTLSAAFYGLRPNMAPEFR